MPGLGSSVARTVAAKRADMPPGVCLDSASNSANAAAASAASTANGKPKLDTSDPRVRKLVYSMYRDMLTTYNGEANDIISKKDPAIVTQDLGVGPILESIIIRQRSSQGGGASDTTGPTSTISEDQSEGGTSSNGTAAMAPPPPPPPPMMPGSIPAVRLSSEIGHRDKGPPAALAGAMMKDKKPFTYTPGGIDLSEIRSPRMAKRIQMNAAAEGVCNVPSSSHQERAPCNLPPAALAAMQPQMAIPVFPQGNMNTVQLNKSHKPADYSGVPPPPPPPMMSPPVMRPQMPPGPSSPQPTLLCARPDSPPQPKSPPPPPARTPPPPPMERAATPKSPIPIMDSHLGASRPISSQLNFQDERPERRSPLGRKSPISPEAAMGVGTGSLFIPPIQSAAPQQQHQAPSPPSQPLSSPVSNYVPPSSRPAGQTKAQAVSQNIGSLYIPPIQQAETQQSTGSSGSTTNGNTSVTRTPQSAQANPNVPQTATSIPATPQLNKAPTPWMNSYNRMQNQQADSPPYVHPGFFMPPWTGPPPGASRTIPIMMAREPDQMDGACSPFQGMTDSRRSSSASGGSTPSGSRTPSQAATHLGRVIPIQIEREEAGRAKGAKIIPIQIEGRPPRGMVPTTPTTPSINPMRRAVGPPPYNSPMGLYSNQNVMDAYQRQAAEAAAAGVDRMNIRCESPRTDPMQSKSMRVIQQAAENELKRIEQEQQESLDMSEDDRHLMSLFKSQVDEGATLHQTAEPRFMGGHIPSKAFRALQTALPTSPAGTQVQPPQSFPAAQPGGPVTHHIPIRQVAQSPTPQSQASEIQFSSQPNVPPSEQKVQEPRKYMGSNIPSRSFKILQAMTAEDGQPAVEGSAETCATEQNIADSYTDDLLSPCLLLDPNNVPLSPCYSSSSYPLSLSCSSDGGGSATLFDPYNNNSIDGNNVNGNNDENDLNSQNPWSEIMDQGWDPYTYMWYYWWYYTSCYWAGYDMTGYEYPPGWDPNYPYCPPEFFSDYSTQSEYTDAATAPTESTTAEISAEHEQQKCNLGRDSSSSTDFHKSLHAENGVGEESYYSHDNNNDDYDDENGRRRKMMMPFIENNSRVAASSSSLSSSVPKIVIEDGEIVAGTGESMSYRDSSSIRKSSGSVDSIKDNNNCSGSLYNNNKNSNNLNGSTTGKAPYTNPLTECNQKPGNPTSLSRKKNVCDSVVVAGEKMWKIEQEDKFAESKQQQLSKNGNDNDVDEKMAHKEKGTAPAGAYDDEQDSSSSSDDEYESCCEDSEQKVIERETGPSSNKPFVTSSASEKLHTAHHFSAAESTEQLLLQQQQQQENRQRKFEFHSNYNSELNANDDGERIRDGKGKGEIIMEKVGNADDNEDDDNDDDEKTDPGTDEDNDDEEDDYGGRSAIIEEPETTSSADDSDMTTTQEDEQRAGKSSFYYSNGLSIEEYHSENSSSESAVFDYGLKKNRLSTIDEITESRASSSVFSRSSATTPTVKNLSAEFDFSSASKNNNNNSTNLFNGNGGKLNCQEKSSHRQNNNDAAMTTMGESDESEESSDELSSVSVIENKSDATRGTTESKREDGATSTSDEDSSTDDDDDDVDEEDDDEDDARGADTAVTVRLPLKLCFTKTKSYKDITTVMVGDSEIEESSQASKNEINEPVAHTTTNGNANDHLVSEDNTFPVDETDDEPVVSFTLSLSRQTSREDETKSRDGKRNEGCNEKDEKREDETTTAGKEDAPDIDFWAEITKGEEKKRKESSGSTTISSSATAKTPIATIKVDEVKSNQESKEDYVEENNPGADMGFWRIICRDRSTSDFLRRRRKQYERGVENCYQNGLSREQVEMRAEYDDNQDWDPSERIDYKWEQDFNFWEKSSRTIETRRFSGNFEITEDYESDTGIKPSVEGKEKRVKKYTHKRHSIPGPSNGWDRSSLPPRPTPKQSTSNFSTNHSPSNCNEQEIKTEDGKFRGCSNNRTSSQDERRTSENSNESLSVRKIVDSNREDTESSSWWSYWDEVTKENGENEKFENNEDNAHNGTATGNRKHGEPGASPCQESSEKGGMEDTAESQEEENSVDVSLEIKLSEGRLKKNDSAGRGESSSGCSGKDDYQSFASMQASRIEAGGNGGFSSLERMEVEVKDRKSLNHSCQSDATTVTTDNEDYSSSPELKSSLLFPGVANQEAEKLIQQGSAYVSVSDENSDESSSRSSGTTIGRHDKSEIKKQILGSVAPSVIPPAPAAALLASDDVGTESESRHLNGSVAVVEEEEEEEEEEDDDGDDEEENTPPAQVDTSVQIPMSIEKCVPIQLDDDEAACERIKLNGKEQQQQHHQEEHYHHHHHHHHHHASTSATTTSTINTTSASATSTTTTTSCTCLMSDRIARAENLLWRIERFLHESLSLGSEDDSGVMTDLSRQISDVDTDVDNDMNETEFLLTAAAAAKERRGMTPSAVAAAANSNSIIRDEHIESCNFGETISSTDASMHHHHAHNQQPAVSPSSNTAGATVAAAATTTSCSSPSTQVKKPRPKSDIFLESTSLSKAENEEAITTSTTVVEESNGVKMRSASERRALRYQRAKTHSRLFQLLQDECCKDDELDEFDYDSDVATPTTTTTTYKTTNGSMVAVDCQINVDASGGSPDMLYHHSPTSCKSNVVNDDSNNGANGSSPTRMSDALARRSRLLPLPIKNLLASSLSLDSNSSPSGSSGVLSPTSPVNRDQLLADIINEFHLRNQASTVRAQNQRRISTSFPSKIFKLLQHEFGEEFYQTFDCCGGGGEESLISPSLSTNLLSMNDSSASSDGAPFVHECTIHKSESMKEFEEATNKILTNFILRNPTTKQNKAGGCQSLSESPSCTANLSSHSLQDDSKNCSSVDFLDVPLRKKKGNLNRDPRSSSKSTKKS